MGSGERRFSSGPWGSPAGSGCSQYSTPSSSSCGPFSSASSSDQYSLTSTCSGTSLTPRTARTRSTSSPSPPPSFSFRRLNRPLTFSARRAMSSGSPSQIVHEVGGPARWRPSSLQTGRPASFPQRSCRAASIAAFAASSPGYSFSRAPIASSANGSSPRSSSASWAKASAEPADSSYRSIGFASPYPETPSCRISTTTASGYGEAPREITKVSAIRRVIVRASSSTRIPYETPVLPLADYLRRIDPPLPRTVWLVQAGGVGNSFGHGVGVPFGVLYLHPPRGG